MADVTLAVAAVQSTPLDYAVPGAAELLVKMLSASYNGAGAAGSFVPAVQVIIGGTLVAGTFPLGQTLAAGASADVSWFPRVAASSGGGGGGTQTQVVPVTFDVPDTAGNGYPAYSGNNGFVNAQRVVPAFVHGVLGTWYASVAIPPNYASGGQLVLSSVANATSGSVRYTVGSAVVAAGVSEDTNYTTEAAVNTVVPGTALRRFDVSFALSTTLAAGSTLNLFVQRQGNNVADTLAVDCLLWQCLLSYTGNT